MHLAQGSARQLDGSQHIVGVALHQHHVSALNSHIGAGTDVAIESADVVLMKSDPYDVLGAIELSRATLRKMHQNLFWAVGYNVIAFPAAAGVFYPLVISPEVAALAMSGSSALVAVNALLLKRTQLDGLG